MSTFVTAQVPEQGRSNGCVVDQEKYFEKGSGRSDMSVGQALFVSATGFSCVDGRNSFLVAQHSRLKRHVNLGRLDLLLKCD